MVGASANSVSQTLTVIQGRLAVRKRKLQEHASVERKEREREKVRACDINKNNLYVRKIACE